MTNYFIFAGETSGDLHGSRLMQALKADSTCLSLQGVGGPRMRAEGLDCFLPMESFQVMGFSDVISALPRLWPLFKQVRDHILKTNPACVILIDYPGFNLRLAKALRNKGYRGKLVQYICPTIWAHGKKRISTLTSYYDLLLTIFPFERGYFKETALRIVYIGNPLVETIHTYTYTPNWMSQVGLVSHRPLIALFPGSRLGEIKQHTSQQLQVAAQIKQQSPETQFALSCAQDSQQEVLLTYLQKSSLKINQDIFIVPAHYRYELMRDCQCALAKSGTVTLELALHQTPTIVHYHLSLLNYLFAKYVLRLSLPHYSLVNIMAQQEIFPEFIGRSVSTDVLHDQLLLLQQDLVWRTRIQEACALLKEQLGQASAQQKAAASIREVCAC